MTYLTALGCVLAIIAIVIVGGVIIAFLGNIIINVFDADRKLNKNIDEDDDIRNIRDNVYSNQTTYKAEPVVTSQKNVKSKILSDETEDYDYAKEIDTAVAKKEKEALEKEIKGYKDDEDDFFADYKSSLKDTDTKSSTKDLDDLELMSMIDEISNDVLDDKKSEVDKKSIEKSKENSSILDKYTVENILNGKDDEDEDEDEDIVVEPKLNNSNDSLNEIKNIRDDIMAMLQELRNTKEDSAKQEDEDKIAEEVDKRVDEKIDENLKAVNELKRVLEEKESEIESVKSSKKELEEKYSEINKKMVEQFANQNREIENQINTTMSASINQINSLKDQLAQLTKQLEEERSLNWKVVETAPVEKATEKEVKLVGNNVVENIVEKEDVEAKSVQEDKNVIIDSDTIRKIADEEVENRVEERLSESNQVIRELSKKVQQLTTETVTTEEIINYQFSNENQYLQRMAVLEERLRVAKKDLKINDKEYKPLEKVKRTLDRDKAKLRRREAIAAKKKVALYGVNNYVDIDKEKAEKLAHELELLDGLRLSVSHCEEVMNSNTERYPVLEHTHYILTNNINDLEADLALLSKELKALRDKDSEGKKN